MRRKEKYMVNGVVIGFSAIAIFDILLQWYEHWQKNTIFTWKSYDGKRTLQNAFIGGGAGAAIGYLAYQNKLANEAKYPFNSDEYLKKVLSHEQLRSNPALFNKFLSYKSSIKEFLNRKFSHKLAGEVEDVGSFFKRTAISSNYDLDIVLPFKKSSYATLEEMYYDVYEIVRASFGNKAVVSKQTKAIGLTFDYNGLPIHFDLVPGREILNYKRSKDLNLYIRPDWVWQKGRSFKTNVDSQKQITVSLPAARRSIRLLKIYRSRNHFTIPSSLIDQSVCEALSKNNYGISNSYTDNFLNCMTVIARKIEKGNATDISNSNNNLLAKMSNSERATISSQLRRDIERIENNPRYIIELFE